LKEIEIEIEREGKRLERDIPIKRLSNIFERHSQFRNLDVAETPIARSKFNPCHPNHGFYTCVIPDGVPKLDSTTDSPGSVQTFITFRWVDCSYRQSIL